MEKCVVDRSQDFGDTNRYHSPSLHTKLQVPKVQRRLVVLTNLGEPISFNPAKNKTNIYILEYPSLLLGVKKKIKGVDYSKKVPTFPPKRVIRFGGLGSLGEVGKNMRNGCGIW